MSGPSSQASANVRMVALPAGERERSTLARIDYVDSFLVDVTSLPGRTAEGWARAVLEQAPAAIRRTLTRGWRTLGLRLGPNGSPRFVLGWEVRRSRPEVALLGADGRLGVSGELLFEKEGHTLRFATFVKLDNAVARTTWTGITPVHQTIVKRLLEQAAAADRSANPPSPS